MTLRSALAAASLAALAALPGIAAAGAVEPPRVVSPEGVSPAVVVDRVVAFVGSRPITRSEVELELRLERAAAGDAAAAMGTATADDLARMLDAFVDRTVVMRGLRSQYVDTLEPAAVEAELERMRAAFASAEAWASFLQRLELSEEEVRERRRRALEASAILAAAVRDLVSIRSDDVSAWLAEHPGVTPEQAEEALRELAAPQVREAILERKRKDLRAYVVSEGRP